MKNLDMIPVDIRHKEFNKGVLGYSKDEVREYLNLVADQMEEMMKHTPVTPQQQPTPETQEQTSTTVNSAALMQEEMMRKEDLISRTLLFAEQSKAEMLENAKKEADNMLKDAELKARKMIDEARHYMNVLEHEYHQLKERKKQFLFHFKAEIEVLLEQINKDSIVRKEVEKEMDAKFQSIKRAGQELKATPKATPKKDINDDQLSANINISTK